MKGVIFPSLGSEPIIEECEMPTPASNQLLVKSLYTAMNPVDAMVPAFGILVKSWPVGLGADASGVVVEAGEQAQQAYGFKKGDYVCGVTRVGYSKEYTTAREYFLMDAIVTMRKPSNLTIPQAATVGAAFETAALGLFQGLKISYANRKDDWILVLGGAGSVGGAAVQIAAAHGYRVVATCSQKSADKVKQYGATDVIDYRDSIDQQLKAVLETTSGDVTKIFDATSAENPQLAKAVFQKVESGPKLFASTNDWSSVGDFEGGTTYEIHLGLSGRTESKELNDQVRENNRMLQSLFEAGRIKPLEYEEIGSGGLEDAIKAFKHKGDGRKVVVKIQDE